MKRLGIDRIEAEEWINKSNYLGEFIIDIIQDKNGEMLKIMI